MRVCKRIVVDEFVQCIMVQSVVTVFSSAAVIIPLLRDDVTNYNLTDNATASTPHCATSIPGNNSPNPAADSSFPR